MSLLSRLAIGKAGQVKEAATRAINKADAGKHADFNAQLEAEITAKQAAKAGK